MTNRTIDMKINEAENKLNIQNSQNLDKEIRAIGKKLIRKHIGALRELAK